MIAIRHTLLRRFCVLTVVVVFGWATTVSDAAAAGGWVHVASPSPSTTGDNNLYGVSASSASSVWTVGFYRTGSTSRALIEHWNGHSWAVAKAPNPSTLSNTLNGITVVPGSASAWTVGDYRGSTAEHALIAHWNGTAWTRFASPNVGGLGQPNFLDGVAAKSLTSAWAVGSTYVAPNYHTVVEHWNGHAWAVQASPTPGGNGELLAASAVPGSTAAWAVGDVAAPSGSHTLIEHWNGTTWTAVPSPNIAGTATFNELAGVSALSNTNAWAVGSANSSQWHPIIEHWNGTKWSLVTSPNPGNGAVLTAITAAASTNIWVVGYYDSATGRKPLILHYNGHAWSQQASAGGETNLYGITTIPGASGEWATGFTSTSGPNEVTFTEHCC